MKSWVEIESDRIDRNEFARIDILSGNQTWTMLLSQSIFIKNMLKHITSPSLLLHRRQKPNLCTTYRIFMDFQLPCLTKRNTKGSKDNPPSGTRRPGYIHNALVEIRLLLLLGCFELRLRRRLVQSTSWSTV